MTSYWMVTMWILFWPGFRGKEQKWEDSLGAISIVLLRNEKGLYITLEVVVKGVMALILPEGNACDCQISITFFDSIKIMSIYSRISWILGYRSINVFQAQPEKKKNTYA